MQILSQVLLQQGRSKLLNLKSPTPTVGIGRLLVGRANVRFFGVYRQSRKYKPKAQGMVGTLEWVQGFTSKKMILLKGFFCKIRRTNLPYVKDMFPVYSVSNMAGHGAFMAMALSYLETDFMMLRIYAASGITLSIVFQYYRDKPLWIPIRWNSLFFVINMIMIGLLLKKERDASYLPDEQKELFMNAFQPFGMLPTEFLQLMHIAERLVYKKGDVMAKQGETRRTLYLMKRGEGVVLRDGIIVGRVKENSFIGEMSFLAYVANKNNEQSEYMISKEKDNDKGWFLAEQADENVVQPLKKWLSWLLPEKTSYEDIENYFLNDNQDKQNASSSSSSDSRDEIAGKKEEGQRSTVIATSTDGNPYQQKFKGTSDVICHEDTIVYSWDYKELAHLIDNYPIVGVAVERKISTDLNQKMTASTQHRVNIRAYIAILFRVCKKGKIATKYNEMLEKERKRLNLSDADHVSILQELGITYREVNEIHMQYANKLSARLIEADQYRISRDEMREFRKERIKKKISEDFHMDCLSENGWDYNDYERGSKKIRKWPYLFDW